MHYLFFFKRKFCELLKKVRFSLSLFVVQRCHKRFQLRPECCEHSEHRKSVRLHQEGQDFDFQTTSGSKTALKGVKMLP